MRQINVSIRLNNISELIKAKEQTEFLTLKHAWRKHCNIVTYDVFREFIHAYSVPIFPKVIKCKGHKVKTHLIKGTNALKLRDCVLNESKQISTHYFVHPMMDSKFSITVKGN